MLAIIPEPIFTISAFDFSRFVMLSYITSCKHLELLPACINGQYVMLNDASTRFLHVSFVSLFPPIPHSFYASQFSQSSE